MRKYTLFFLAILLYLPIRDVIAAKGLGLQKVCVGEFCFNSHIIRLTELAKYGKGYENIEPELAQYGSKNMDENYYKLCSSKNKEVDCNRCFYVAGQDVWVSFGVSYHLEKMGKIDSVFISGEPMCPKKYTPAKTFKKFTTDRGIGIGSLVGDILKKYGKPKRIDNALQREERNPQIINTFLASKYGNLQYVYYDENDLLSYAFYIKNGIVFSILISNSE